MLATPFTDDGEHVDHPSLRRYCDEVAARGCAAVVVLGVIGEPSSLSEQERLAVIDTALASGVEVHVAVMARTAVDRMAEAVTVAEAFGARAAGLLVPIATPDPAELTREVAALHARTGYPVVLQDYPASSGTRIDIDDLAAAVRGLPSVLAIKCEAPPTFGRIRRLRELVPGVTTMSGLGGLSLVDDLDQGARLVASGTSRPEVAVQASNAWCEGDVSGARSLVGAAAAGAAFETQQGTSVAIRKEHWRRQGVLASSAVRAPAMPYEPWMRGLSDAHGFLDGAASDVAAPHHRPHRPVRARHTQE
jgi:4-hydroxy-tetrahydrodipicolinate synthase